MMLMLSLLFKIIPKRSKLEESIIEIQNGDTQLQNEIIQKYKPFVAKTVSSVCKRYIQESDDEFSIGLIAFNEAIEKYSCEKGRAFIAFSELVIKRRVIDYIRKESRQPDIALDFTPNDDDGDMSTQSHIDIKQALDQHNLMLEQEQRKAEIELYVDQLKDFGLTIKDLQEQSPKHEDARQNAINVAKTLVEHEELKTLLFEKKQIPMKLLQSYVTVSRKTLERNRKYIIAIAIILSGDFVFLRDYIKGGAY
ncbi:RNA polymerase sigma factor SigI [Bacillus sp. HMF5848]|uniref:RNA polymerase sigma factor SigI n=1 Tax=Bacillus sp. HMF5848 TaxID=2495421 RepID=UPI000F7999B2|nr:RNA polymerase sigma factor SigI [Bacillus sp. HMF5848]RSK26702.1 RNA polymerase sigma factor SigI [Bacillus sp. HMF5848]